MRTLKLLHYKDEFCVVFPEIERSQVRLPASAPPCNNSGQVVNTHVPLLPTVQFGTDQRMVMLCGREGNCRSGVALAMQPDFKWFIHLWAHGQGKGNEHPTYTHSGMVCFTFTLPWLDSGSILSERQNLYKSGVSSSYHPKTFTAMYLWGSFKPLVAWYS